MRFSVNVSILIFLFATLSVTPTARADRGTVRAALQSRYSRAHSLGHSYKFDARDGWQTVNVTNLQYKYRNSGPEVDDANIPSIRERATKNSKSQHSYTKQGLGSTIVDTIKVIGGSVNVIITWYTGHDLLNPSCWTQTGWAPTDDSFVCALTLDGWTTRPKCFDFLQLCNSPKACVFVRVVDTCQGCAKGSKHVDLTQRAFSQLAPLNEGMLSVQMRIATAPTQWNEKLWGPKEP